MVQINEMSLGVYHRVIANKEIKEMKPGDMKDVLIQKMSDGRYCVMGLFLMLNGKVIMDMFHCILQNESELHDYFTEQFTNLTGFTATK